MNDSALKSWGRSVCSPHFISVWENAILISSSKVFCYLYLLGFGFCFNVETYISWKSECKTKWKLLTWPDSFALLHGSYGDKKEKLWFKTPVQQWLSSNMARRIIEQFDSLLFSSVPSHCSKAEVIRKESGFSSAGVSQTGSYTPTALEASWPALVLHLCNRMHSSCSQS